MVFFAKDKDEIVSAWDADPQKKYTCLGCLAPLKYRKSKLQFPHFYHQLNVPTCRIQGKSKRHLLIQLEIQKRLSGALIEKPFRAISRIADVVFEKEKLIFEIQCSKISEKEAQERTLQYQGLGYKVVWILDDLKFNKRHIGNAEIWMRQNLCYFVNKTLLFYDQTETIRNKKRTNRSNKKIINISNISQKTISFNPEIIKRKDGFKQFFLRFFLKPYLSKIKSWVNAAR